MNYGNVVRTNIYIRENEKDESVVFEMDSSNNAGFVLLYTLRLLRIKGKDFKEILSIELLDEHDNPNGEIKCSPLSIENDLYQLRAYGTNLSRGNIMKLSKVIDTVYRHIGCVTDNSFGDIDLEKYIVDILRLICEYINSHKIKSTNVKDNVLYNIPVMDFKNIFKGTDYKNCKYKDIKKALNNNGYTECSTGRTDNLVLIEDKNTRVVSIRADEPEVIDRMEELANAEKKTPNE